jgi:hypothetical protein
VVDAEEDDANEPIRSTVVKKQRRRGTYDRTTSHNNGSKRYWTLGRCRVEARKYVSRMEYMTKSPASYQASQRYGYLDTVCKHMGPRRYGFATKKVAAPVKITSVKSTKTRPRYPKYTEEQIRIEAAKYPTAVEFRRANRSMFQAAAKRQMFGSLYPVIVNTAPVTPSVEVETPRRSHLIDSGIAGIPSIEDIDLTVGM